MLHVIALSIMCLKSNGKGKSFQEAEFLAAKLIVHFTWIEKWQELWLHIDSWSTAIGWIVRNLGRTKFHDCHEEIWERCMSMDLPDEVQSGKTVRQRAFFYSGVKKKPRSSHQLLSPATQYVTNGPKYKMSLMAEMGTIYRLHTLTHPYWGCCEDHHCSVQ